MEDGFKLRRVARPLDRELTLLSEREARLRQEQIKFKDLTEAAFAEENTMSWLFNGVPDFEPDPEFFLEEEEFEELTKDLPQEYKNIVFDAQSRGHAEALVERAKESVENNQTLDEFGFGGAVMRGVAGVLDPGLLAAGTVGGVVVAPLMFGQKATRIGNFVRGGLGGATMNTAAEAYLVSQNATKDPYDILYGAAGGLVLGGILGGAFGRTAKKSLTEPEMSKALANMQRDIARAEGADHVEEMRRRGILTDEEARNTGVGADEAPMSRDVQIDEIRPGLAEKLEEAGEPAFASFGPVRIDMTGELKSSKLVLTRKEANALLEDAVGLNRDGENMEATADILKTISFKSNERNFYIVYDDAFKDWAKSNKISFAGRQFNTTRQRFGELVADAIERPDLPHDANVLRAATNQAELFRKILREAKEAGVRGFENIPENLRYFTHMWRPARFQDMNTKYGHDNVDALLKKAIMRGQPDITEDLAKKIAENMNKKLRKAEAGMDSGLARVFTTDDRDVLTDILVEEGILSPEDAARLANIFKVSPEGVSARAKRRIELDTETETTLSDGSIIRIKDLMNRNAEDVFNSYNNQLSGRIAVAKKGIKSDADFTRRMQDILAEGESKGLSKQAKNDVENLEIGYSLIVGRASPRVGDPGSTYNRAARLIADFNFIRVMNQVGFTQIAEIGAALSIGGVRGLAQALPEFKKFLNRAKNGDLEDEVVNEIEAFYGIGSDRLVRRSQDRFDYEDSFVDGRNDIIDKATSVLQPAKRITADASGLALMTLALERAAVRMASQKITDAAFNSKAISTKMINGLGLGDGMSERVFNQIKKHALTQDSALFRNKKIKNINLSKWDDEDARDAFGVAIARWSRRSIQQNDVGNLNKYMTGTMGKLIVQFRSFMLVSYSKQFLHAIKRNEMDGYTAMMGSVFFAGVGYAAQTSLNAQFRDDKEEYLKERLSLEEIGKAAFQRSSWASIIPPIFDTAYQFYENEPYFAFGRSTGLASDFFNGIPTVDLINKAGKAATGASRSILNEDIQWSQSHQRALNSLIPFQNAIGIRNAMNKLLEDLPETSRVE